MSFGRAARVRVLICLVVLSVTLLVGSPAEATDYYVSADGSDANAGTTPGAPWQTLERLEQVRLQPGDQVFLRGGDLFWGSITLDPDEGGTPDLPITITSYGEGRATIHAGDGTAIGGYNVAGYFISNLNVEGSGRTTNLGTGIHFYTDLTGNVLLPYVEIDRVEASGFGGYGVAIGGTNGGSGYSDVFLVQIVAHDNGWLNNYSAGPVGIWAYDSRNVLIQRNESHHNRTGGTKDGGGFGFDQNMSFSVMQHNYSHDNHGAGFLLAMRYGTHAHTNNVVRYNISQNDSRKVGYGAIHLWGGIRKTEIHNNTVFLSKPPAGTPYALLFKSSSYTANDLFEVHIRNNIFQTTGGVRLVYGHSTQIDGAIDLEMERNAYYTTGGSFRID